MSCLLGRGAGGRQLPGATMLLWLASDVSINPREPEGNCASCQAHHDVLGRDGPPSWALHSYHGVLSLLIQGSPKQEEEGCREQRVWKQALESLAAYALDLGKHWGLELSKDERDLLLSWWAFCHHSGCHSVRWDGSWISSPTQASGGELGRVLPRSSPELGTGPSLFTKRVSMVTKGVYAASLGHTGAKAVLGGLRRKLLVPPPVNTLQRPRGGWWTGRGQGARSFPPGGHKFNAEDGMDSGHNNFIQDQAREASWNSLSFWFAKVSESTWGWEHTHKAQITPGFCGWATMSPWLLRN